MSTFSELNEQATAAYNRTVKAYGQQEQSAMTGMVDMDPLPPAQPAAVPAVTAASSPTQAAPPALDSNDTLGYLGRLFEPGDWIDLQFIHQTETWTDEHGAKHAKVDDNFLTLADVLKPENLQHIRQAQDKGWNAYVGMNAFTPGLSRRRKKDVKTVRTVYVEFDENGALGLEKIQADVEAGLISAPHFVLESSPAKFYVIWLVTGFTVPQQEALNSALQKRYGSDPASVDAARVLRLPGTRNLKPKYNPTPVVSIIRQHVAGRYSAADFKIEINVREHKESAAIASEKLADIADVIVTALDEASIEHGSPEPYDDGLKIDLDECLWGRAEGHHRNGDPSGAAVFIDASGRLGYCCFHSWCKEHYHWAECRAELEKRAGHALRFGDADDNLSDAMKERIAQKVQEQHEQAEEKKQQSAATVAEPVQYAMTATEIEAEYEKPYPVFLLVEPGGPTWDDDIMYGIAGEIVRKASEYNESHPAGMYLDLLVSMGNIFGRHAHFSVNATQHHTNEFLARVGLSSKSRKGSGRDVIDEIISHVDPKWYQSRVMNGFGSAQAIVDQMRDSTQQQIRNKKTGEFKTMTVPGVDDKRLYIREGELASVFQEAAKPESRADIVLRDGWDGKALNNIVKGKTVDGFSNSLRCAEPHLSISGDTTKAELFSKMPSGAADNGLGNRFLYCYAPRVKQCPLGGPQLDWSQEIIRLYEAVKFAQSQAYVPLTKAAEKMWIRMYMDMENDRPSGMAESMTARGPAHVRRLAMILALLDLSAVIESRHLQAAKRIWDYCQESAEYIFSNCTREQGRILSWVDAQRVVTSTQVREELFHRNRKAAWVKAQLVELVKQGRLNQNGDKFESKQRAA